MANRPLKVMVMAGGTGGHVFPALSVAKQLQSEGAFIKWLGTARGIEATLVPNAGIELHCLNIEGVRGKGIATKLKAPFLLLSAVWHAMQILRQQNPDVVLGLGGFASGPGGLAARLLGKPLVIHEQNAVAGTTNRWLAKVATRVLEAFPGSLPNAQLVGNPVREEIANLPQPQLRISANDEPLKLLVLGGSLGALALNELLPQALAADALAASVVVRHQAGKNHLEKTRALYREQGIEIDGQRVRVDAFVEDMAEAYGWADVVICRAGALTVAELTAAGSAALLVPYPYAIDDHQTKNAMWLVDNQAAEIKQQSELSADVITTFITHAMRDRSRLVTMASNARKLAMPDAAHKVAAVCREVAGEKANA
jgi:UDP-N-acetylglucosamine--N-acetylmuramyl-(pentapeptide) pyrophosphoryl-undecaprenol N-acetylglucosamine transferase